MTAGTVFVGGRVFTGTGQPIRAGLAVAAGRIVAIGTDAEVRELAGPRTDTVDLAGGLLLPGFQDAHVHPLHAGVRLRECDLTDAHSAGEYVRIVRDFAASHPDREWITGGGWEMAAFPGGTPTRDLLDAVVPGRPVYLPNRDAHGAWVNSRALALAGIEASTLDPADGRIERDAEGRPTGTLHEGAATLVGRLVPPLSADDLAEGLLAAQRRLFSLGVTGWQDAIVGEFLGFPDPYDTYVRLAADGRLKARVVGALWWDRDRGLAQVPSLVERRVHIGRFAATSVKIMQDGVAENYTAAMTQPYRDACGHSTTNSGLSFVDPSALREYVTRLDAIGFQVHFHALGDRAVREALDALAAARDANGPTDNRHHLAHLQVVHPDDVPRFARLGATANIQALWACRDAQMVELTLPYLGGDLAGRQYPFGDLYRSGAHLAAGSDWPVSSPDPLAAAHVAVTRTAPDTPDAEPLLPAQRLDLAAYLRAYTLGAAYVNHLDGVAGSIAPGKSADLVVLDRDPFTGPAERIAAARVTRTYLAGELVHAADQ